MSRLATLCLLFFFAYGKGLFSQNTHLADSLYQLILLEKNDSARAVLYDQLSLVFFNSNIDSAEALVRKSCFFAQKSGCTSCLALCYKGLGFAKNRRFQLDEAILLYDTAQVWAGKSKNWCVLSFNYANKGGAFNRKFDFETALKWNRKSIEISESNGCTDRVFGLYFNLYNTLRNMGRNLEAIAPLRRAVEIAEKSRHTNDYLIYYFPSEKLVFEDDLAWIAKEGELKKAGARQRGLFEAIRDLNLDVETVVQSWPVAEHGVKTVFPFSDLEKSAALK